MILNSTNLTHVTLVTSLNFTNAYAPLICAIFIFYTQLLRETADTKIPGRNIVNYRTTIKSYVH